MKTEDGEKYLSRRYYMLVLYISRILHDKYLYIGQSSAYIVCGVQYCRGQSVGSIL